MSLSDAIIQASFSSQKDVYSDPIFFQDDDGGYTIEGRGIFKAAFNFVDSTTQQDFVANTPTLWVSRPAPVRVAQGVKVKWKESYFRIKEVHNDVDRNAYNLLLHEIKAPAG